MDITEQAFESHIADHLVQQHGYRLRTNGQYDKSDCLDCELVLEFITTTQPETGQALAKQHAATTEEKGQLWKRQNGFPPWGSS